MTSSRDRVYEALLEVIFNQRRDRELLREMHGKICANPQEDKTYLFIGKGMFAEMGRTLLRIFVPAALPYILAWLTWLGAMFVLGYKLAVKFIFGS